MVRIKLQKSETVWGGLISEGVSSSVEGEYASLLHWRASLLHWRSSPLLILTLLPLWWDGSLQTVDMQRFRTSILSDAEALVEFKQAVDDPHGILSGWKAEAAGSVCGWQGVICASSRVIELHLRGALLSGRLPEAAISKLDQLQVLSLQGNRFYGDFTGAFLTDRDNGLSCSVQTADLSSNNLTGSIPSRILHACGSLIHLNLSFNAFTDLLAPDRGSTPSLEVLDLSHNQISGELDPQIFAGNLRSLNLSHNSLAGGVPPGIASCQTLILSSNELSGELPSFLMLPKRSASQLALTSLQTLNLSGNRLMGIISPSLGRLTNLRSLDLSDNNLSGVIPPELTDTCQALQELDLSRNNLSGPLPVGFSACKSLVSISLCGNLFSGRFPTILGEMQALKSLRIADNFFEGSLPDVGNCSALEILDLSSNSFSGGLPLDGICNPESSLKMLFVPENFFAGVVPASIANCTKLQLLDLSFNSLTGTIPPELSNLSDLQHLILWNNNFTGAIPAEFGSSPNLETLIASFNNLNGAIPTRLFNCSHLRWLSLTNNALHGSIPTEIGQSTDLTLLQLSSNSLSGYIPLELANCTSLIWLDLNNNNLSGVIPATIGRRENAPILAGAISSTVGFADNLNDQCRGAGMLLEFEGIRWNRLSRGPILASCKYRFYKGTAFNVTLKVKSLLFLDLSYNNLVGTLPPEFGHMEDLIVLDLGHNQLNGTIPPSLGLLNKLETLHLAHNWLEGNIPLSFSNLTFLSNLNISNNRLSGPIPSGGQLTTFPPSVYAMNDGLCNAPLESCSPSRPHTPPNVPHLLKDGYASRRFKTILGFAFCMASLICLSFYCFCHKMERKRRSKEGVYPWPKNWKASCEEPLSINVAIFERALKKLTFLDLLEATKGFDAKNLLGSGGFGEVYKAQFKDGSVLAVKRLTRFSYQGEKQFLSEMETLGKINHPNLVPLLGYCKIGEERILVYDYMPCGNLEQLLHEEHIDKARVVISWNLRKHIILDLARGLAFLHHKCIPHVIHRDMKSNNVLLNISFEARLSDFGMARLMSASDTHNSVTSLAGTPGYVPPEYYQSSRCTREGDVYSFGVVLLEILTRRRPTDNVAFEDKNLVGWVKLNVHESKCIDVLDPDLGNLYEKQEEMLECLSVACKCVEDQPTCRPSMLQVLDVLESLSFS